VVGTEDSYFLTPMLAEDLSCLEETHLAEIPMILDQNKANVITPRETPEACNLLRSACAVNAAGVYSCIADEDAEGLQGTTTAHCQAVKDSDICTCSYTTRQPECKDWFDAEDHLVPVIGTASVKGMVLATGRGCKCSEDKCSFQLLSELPLVRILKESESAFKLGGSA